MPKHGSITLETNCLSGPASQVPFSRRRQDALELASQYDLCISGDGLTHLQQIGAEASFVPLAQARIPPYHLIMDTVQLWVIWSGIMLEKNVIQLAN